MSISQTASDLTGRSQSAGVERQPGVENLRCKARKPLVPPTTSIWRPEITESCRWCNRAGHRGSSMLGFYRAVAEQQVASLEKRSVSTLIEVMADERWER